MQLKELQQRVDAWISGIGGGYFPELANMAIMTEEVGELARVIVRKYGPQVAKRGDLDKPLADEMADVLWVLVCLANQTGVDLAEAFEANIRKKTGRDLHRFEKMNSL